MEGKILRDDMEEKESILVLEKGKRGLHRAIFSRTVMIILMLVVQILVLLIGVTLLNSKFPLVWAASLIVAVGVGIHLFNKKRMDPTVKLTWLGLIAVAPVFGALLYIFIQMDTGHRKLRDWMGKIIDDTRSAIPPQQEVMEELKQTAPEVAQLATYVSHSGCYPIYRNSQVTYFPTGEDKFEALLRELEGAKAFIFLEYFIIDEGYMWGRVLEILARKAREGVEVRVLYDGTLEFSTLSHRYPQELEELGIACRIFAPIRPFVSTHYNYRDHRKILVIDGHTAFTGGINLADEYINRRERFGHWKDTAIMVKGEAVPSFTLMFLQMWNVIEQEPHYEPWVSASTGPAFQVPGYVMPYGDCPVDDYQVGETVYLDMLNRAERYVHIMTPYLILDGEMENALRFAAQRGVEVQLILPHIPDKKYAFALAKTYYASLLEAGVELYEYIPGFIHAKVFVCDDRKGTVGTINLDYRSLYHHFECGAYLYEVPALADIERDFQETLTQCQKVTMEDVQNRSFWTKAEGALLRTVAPLL